LGLFAIVTQAHVKKDRFLPGLFCCPKSVKAACIAMNHLHVRLPAMPGNVVILAGLIIVTDWSHPCAYPNQVVCFAFLEFSATSETGRFSLSQGSSAPFPQFLVLLEDIRCGFQIVANLACFESCQFVHPPNQIGHSENHFGMAPINVNLHIKSIGCLGRGCRN
jgi:hypothetical protein